MARFVALGDSLTEGVGDPHPLSPNGWRGWADLLALELARTNPELDYANFAVRAKRAQDVLNEQLPSALALRPTLVTFWAGGNDILRPGGRMEDVAASIDSCVRALRTTGAQVLLFSGYDLPSSPVLRVARARLRRLSHEVADIADAAGAAFVDVSTLREWSPEGMFTRDRVHPSPLGHLHLARAAADVLGLRTGLVPDRQLPPTVRPRRRDRLHEEGQWWRETVVPQVKRWATNASLREGAGPKWPEPVRPSAWPQAQTRLA